MEIKGRIFSPKCKISITTEIGSASVTINRLGVCVGEPFDADPFISKVCCYIPVQALIDKVVENFNQYHSFLRWVFSILKKTYFIMEV